MAGDDPCFLTAREIAARIRRRDLSAREVMEAHLARIERLNPKLNAIPTLLPDIAMAGAAAADEALARGDDVGALHGLPIAHKDLVETKGIRTTFGSPIYAENVPARDALLVERIRAAGAVMIGKTNTPEFGAGSQTFNPVFGATLNPYDTTKTCGGSSGGAAVALASGMLPIADGSDTGGSLRNPANFNNVVGFRASPGLVPSWPSRSPWSVLSVQGPMARTVGDVALFLSAIAGFDARAPLSYETNPARFAAPLDRDFRGVRIAWSRDLGGLPVDPRVSAVIDAQRSTFEDLGCIVEDADPELEGADEVFKTFRALGMVGGYGELLRTHRAMIKDTVIWNTEQGLRLTPADIARAERLGAGIFARMHDFMARYEFLVCPVNQVPPFDVDTEYVTEINGVPMETYIDWMKTCSYITVTAQPAISVPAGFTEEGLPVGLQIVGRLRDEFGVLQLANAFEGATGYWQRHPAMAL